MALKKYTYMSDDGDKRVCLFWDATWQEWIVRFYAVDRRDNSTWVHMDNSDYHTFEEDDAHDTAIHALDEEREWCEANNLC